MKRSELKNMLEMYAAKNTEIEALKARIAELEGDLQSSESSLEAQRAKFDGCPHSSEQQCGCSYDDPTHVCSIHAPQLQKALKKMAKLEGVDASILHRARTAVNSEQIAQQKVIAVLKVLEQCEAALGSIEHWWEEYSPNVKEFPISAMYAATAAISEVQKPFVAPEPDPDVRYILTAPVPHGNAWWNIVRQIRRDEEWIPSPDFALVNVSIRTPNAEAVARKLLSDLQASSKEEA
jgi:hypothetical protein